jgi:hypothetical protein
MYNFILCQFLLVPTKMRYVCMYVYYIYKQAHTNDATCTREIKSRIAMEKAAFKREKFLFTSNLNLYLREKLVKLLHLEHSFVWCWKLDTSGSRSEIPGKFPNVLLEKDGDQLDRSCEKCSVIQQCNIVRGIRENIDTTGNETWRPK